MKKNIKLEYRYDGSNYYGLQRQPNQNTIQGEIEKSLKLLLKEDINLISAGRTDRAVHANHQVSNFLTNSNIPIDKYKYILNRLLPKDIDILNVEEVNLDFNSRFDAKSREYVYIISWEKTPFETKYCKFVDKKIDAQKLENILKDFIGVKNFKNFRLNDCSSKTTIREILDIRVEYFEKSKIKIFIKGSSFLKSQVRIMIGTALQIYNYTLPDNYIKLLFEDFSREYKKNLVEAEGLYLNKIEY